MTTQTITARQSINGIQGGATYTNGTATVDDTTLRGKAAIAFAKRHGWAVSNGIATAVVLNPASGKAVAKWTSAECKAYLDNWQVTYPSGAPIADLRNAVLTAYETRAQGGSAALPTAGHIMGTFPVEGAPIVPGDDASKAGDWHTPITGSASPVGGAIDPAITTQPASVSKVAPATATFTVVATGTPAPSFQWFRQAKGAGDFVAIPDATAASYTTAANSVATNNGDKFHVVLTNEIGELTSADATLTVTAS